MTVFPEDTYDAGGKAPDEIECDIAATRADLGAVLDALEQRLAPRQLVERGMDMVRETMNGDGLGEILRANPVPLALIGAGIGWLFVANTAGDRAAELARDVADKVSDGAREVSDKTRAVASGIMDYATDKAAPDLPYQAGEEMAGYAYARTKPQFGAAAVSAATETARGARASVNRAIDDYPLALGFVGLLAGAALALLLPQSKAEERWIGPAGARLRDEAAALGRDAVDRAQQVAEFAADAVAEAARTETDTRQG